MLIDSPGYGYIYNPVYVKNQWKKVMSGYLSHSVRLNLVLMLVNADIGLKGTDLTILN